jgi:hypothetical protein
MDPLLAFISIFSAAIIVCLAATLTARPPTRSCADCGRQTPVQARRCRHCGYGTQPGWR